jgi:hypothetical protein
MNRTGISPVTARSVVYRPTSDKSEFVLVMRSTAVSSLMAYISPRGEVSRLGMCCAEL